MSTTFGECLLQAIQIRNLSQKEAAKMLNLSPQTLNNYILNKRTPDLQTLSHILEVFPMEPNEKFRHDNSYDQASSEEEIELLSIFRQMNLEQQKFILLMLKELPK